MDEAAQIGIAIVKHKDRVLVGVRQSHQVLAGLAEFPGGKCELGEDPKDCAVRECLEETGIAVHCSKRLDRVAHTYDHGKVELHFYQCELQLDCKLAADDFPKASGNFKWVLIEELRSMEFPEANRPIIARLQHENTR
jgi:mutator protein MutT